MLSAYYCWRRYYNYCIIWYRPISTTTSATSHQNFTRHRKYSWSAYLRLSATVAESVSVLTVVIFNFKVKTSGIHTASLVRVPSAFYARMKLTHVVLLVRWCEQHSDRVVPSCTRTATLETSWQPVTMTTPSAPSRRSRSLVCFHPLTAKHSITVPIRLQLSSVGVYRSDTKHCVAL